MIKTTDLNLKNNRMENFKWKLPEQKEKPVGDGDIRVVNLPVKVLFEWSDQIVADYDKETDTVLEYTSGYLMKVLPEQSFVYCGEESNFIANTLKSKKEILKTNSMSTKKYRLIREYPGSPKIGDIINTSKNFKGESLYYDKEVCFKPSDYPEFWEEVEDTTTIVSVRRESDKKVFSVGDIVLIEDFIHRIKSIYIDSFESVWLEVYLIDSPNIVSHVLLDSI